MLIKVKTATVVGVEAIAVDVEVDSFNGIPGFQLVGLVSGAVREGTVRIRAALNNCGFKTGSVKLVVNLAPADVRKDGTLFDLPIAIGVLIRRDLMKQQHGDLLLAGELSMDGRVKPIRGALSLARAARRMGMRGIVLPRQNAQEAALVEGLRVYGVESLVQAVGLISGTDEIAPTPASPPRLRDVAHPVDFAEVCGQAAARRAAEVAVAGGHNLMLIGSPGSGKTMIAKRMVTILPPPTVDEAIETTMVHSVAGLLNGDPLVARRPFRAPHHTCSSGGLVGGGSNPRPGEVSLAHNGLLFLDEFPEFQRGSLEAMRQPLEDGQVTIVRTRYAVTYPASFMLIAAMNPCPCGYRGSRERTCTCGEQESRRYLSRISGPLLDRFDLFIQVQPVETRKLIDAAESEPSEAISRRVTRARSLQQRRFQRCRIHCNAEMNTRQLKRYVPLNHVCKQLLEQYARAHNLSGRALHRTCKVARTLADLEGGDPVTDEHLTLALTLQHARWT